MIASYFNLQAELSCRDRLPDGRVIDYGVVSRDELLTKWQARYRALRRSRTIPAYISFGAFLSWILGLSDPSGMLAVVTTAGVNYMAADFLAASVAHIQDFKYHDTGTGTNAEAITDVALQTPTGIARATGIGTNPTANVYRSSADITYDGGYNITEWALFSAAAAGTCWDRRVFVAIPVVLNTVRTWVYNLTINAGG